MAKPGTLHATPQLYERRARGESLRSLAADFGVSKTAMSVHFSGPGKPALEAALRERQLKADIDRMEADQAAAPPKRKRAPNRERTKDKGPDPGVWQRGTESYDAFVARQAARGNRGRLLVGRRWGAITWS